MMFTLICSLMLLMQLWGSHELETPVGTLSNGTKFRGPRALFDSSKQYDKCNDYETKCILVEEEKPSELLQFSIDCKYSEEESRKNCLDVEFEFPIRGREMACELRLEVDASTIVSPIDEDFNKTSIKWSKWYKFFSKALETCKVSRGFLAIYLNLQPGIHPIPKEARLPYYEFPFKVMKLVNFFGVDKETLIKFCSFENYARSTYFGYGNVTSLIIGIQPTDENDPTIYVPKKQRHLLDHVDMSFLVRVRTIVYELAESHNLLDDIRLNLTSLSGTFQLKFIDISDNFPHSTEVAVLGLNGRQLKFFGPNGGFPPDTSLEIVFNLGVKGDFYTFLSAALTHKVKLQLHLDLIEAYNFGEVVKLTDKGFQIEPLDTFDCRTRPWCDIIKDNSKTSENFLKNLLASCTWTGEENSSTETVLLSSLVGKPKQNLACKPYVKPTTPGFRHRTYKDTIEVTPSDKKTESTRRRKRIITRSNSTGYILLASGLMVALALMAAAVLCITHLGSKHKFVMKQTRGASGKASETQPTVAAPLPIAAKSPVRWPRKSPNPSQLPPPPPTPPVIVTSSGKATSKPNGGATSKVVSKSPKSTTNLVKASKSPI